MNKNPFSDQELKRRLLLIHEYMDAHEFDALILAQAESVFYLTGLDHWGYFAPTYLYVRRHHGIQLVTRQMELVTIQNQVRNAEFIGHTDSETASSKLLSLLSAQDHRIGLEFDCAGLNYLEGMRLAEGIGNQRLVDISGQIDNLRHVKSPEEITIVRQAARVSDLSMQAAIAAIHDGAAEVEVVAEAEAAAIRAGGNPPGFGPFIRPEERISEEHTTWGNGYHHRDCRVFLELAGCVSRYHAPMGRLVHIGSIKDEDAEMASICGQGFEAVLTAMQAGNRAKDVYQAWQDVVDTHGMSHYRRHHCGYFVGIAFPPAWVGSNKVTGLRHDSERELQVGMTFHAMSWLTDTGRGEYFVSNTVLLGEKGAELLTRTPFGPTIR